jgi:hypothetical protein
MEAVSLTKYRLYEYNIIEYQEPAKYGMKHDETVKQSGLMTYGSNARYQRSHKMCHVLQQSIH